MHALRLRPGPVWPVTRWLTGDQQRVWRSFLEVHRLLFERLDRQLSADSGLSHADYEILVRLSEADGRALRMSELAEATQSSRSRLSHAVARLEAQHWVARRECPSDKRGTVAALTDAGFAALAAAAPGHVEAVREALLDPLSAAQLEALGEISATLLAHLGSDDEGARRAP